MLNSMIRGGLVLAASLCAVVFTSCGVTPLYYPPVDDKSPAEMFDAETRAALLKGGTYQAKAEDVTVTFSEYTLDDGKKDDSASKDGIEKNALRGMATMIDKDKEKSSESWLPVLVVPFRYADALYFFLTLDHMYIMEKTGLNPEYIFMTRPYSYILKAEPEEGDAWKVAFVQFATTGLEVKKVAEQAQIDKDGTVFNPPAEILDMLKDPGNYKTISEMVFVPVKGEEETAESAR